MGLRVTVAGTVAPTAILVSLGADATLRSLISSLMTWRCSSVRLTFGWAGTAGAAGAAGVWAWTVAAKLSKVTGVAAINTSATAAEIVEFVFIEVSVLGRGPGSRPMLGFRPHASGAFAKRLQQPIPDVSSAARHHPLESLSPPTPGAR